MSQSFVLACTFYETRHVRQGAAFSILKMYFANIGLKSGKGIGSDLGACAREGSKEGRFTRIRISDEADISDELHL